MSFRMRNFPVHKPIPNYTNPNLDKPEKIEKEVDSGSLTNYENKIKSFLKPVKKINIEFDETEQRWRMV